MMIMALVWFGATFETLATDDYVILAPCRVGSNVTVLCRWYRQELSYTVATGSHYFRGNSGYEMAVLYALQSRFMRGSGLGRNRRFILLRLLKGPPGGYIAKL